MILESETKAFTYVAEFNIVVFFNNICVYILYTIPRMHIIISFIYLAYHPAQLVSEDFQQSCIYIYLYVCIYLSVKLSW